MSAYNVGNLGSNPGSGGSPGEGNGNPLQHLLLLKLYSLYIIYGSAPSHLLSRTLAEGMIFFRDIPSLAVERRENIVLRLSSEKWHISHLFIFKWPEQAT